MDGYNTSAVYLFYLCAVSKTEVHHMLYVNDKLDLLFLSSFDHLIKQAWPLGSSYCSNIKPLIIIIFIIIIIIIIKCAR